MASKNRLEVAPEQQILVDTKSLMKMLDSGRANAVKIGEAAKARVQIGSSLFWNVRRIREYLEEISA